MVPLFDSLCDPYEVINHLLRELLVFVNELYYGIDCPLSELLVGGSRAARSNHHERTDPSGGVSAHIGCRIAPF